MKKCSICKTEKEPSEFSKHKCRKDGLRENCKSCDKQIREQNKKYRKEYSQKRQSNLTDQDKELIKLKRLEYYRKNKAAIDEKKRIYIASNLDAVKIRKKNYYLKNKERLINYSREYNRNKYQQDKHYKLKMNIKSRINLLLKKQHAKKSNRTLELLGCDLETLMIHLESKFSEGMSWENHGLYGWHIDHIIPCSHFDLTDFEQQKRCFHYTNLQPLWAKDNLVKSDKYDK
jgi:hypothetical protein